jgi:HK97 family phage portal protein
MSIFGGLFKARAPDREASKAPKVPLYAFSKIARPLVSYSNVVAAEAAMEHPIVFRMLNKLATTVQAVKFLAIEDPEAKGQDRANATELKNLNALLQSPNDNMTQAQFLFWATLNFACYGRIPFKVSTSIENRPNAIYPLEARFVHAMIDERGMVVEYQYGLTDDDRSQVMDTRKTADKKKSTKGWVSEIYTPNLSGHFAAASIGLHNRNTTPLACIGLPTQVTRLLMERALDTASNGPNTKYIVSAEKSLTEKQKQSVREHTENSASEGDESGNILFLSNTSIKVDELSNDLSDLHSKIPMEDYTKLIAGAFGIPAALLGLNSADSAKYASNYKESRISFYHDTIIPGYLEPIARGLTVALCPPGIIIKADLDDIPAIADSRVAMGEALSKISYLTISEKRDLTDYEPLTAQQEEALVEQNRKTPTADATSQAPKG